jgi:arabinofuranosyltransferase
MIIAWSLRFNQDDSFIFYRYAKNFADGQGLVWNIGEPPVEGYTSLLWTLLISLGAALGWELTTWSYVLGLLFGAGSLGAIWRLTAQLGLRGDWRVAGLWIAGSNYSFLAYMTGGLETSLQVNLLLWLTSLSIDPAWRAPRRLCVWSLVAALALMTRLDAAIFVVVLGLQLLWAERARGAQWLARAVLAMSAPAAALLIPWFVWRWSFYGELLPNTFYAKTSGGTLILFGMSYTAQVAMEYGLWIGLLASKMVRDRDGILPDKLKVILWVMLCWVLYVVRIGGDFMEFRFYICVLPLLLLVITRLLAQLDRGRVTFLVVGLLTVFNVKHACFYGNFNNGILSIPFLRAVGEDDSTLVVTGKTLKGMMRGQEEALRIAVMPVGAIAYYSELFTIDMYGLMDHWVARHGQPHDELPGHQRAATYSYVKGRGVHLLMSFPRFAPLEAPYVPLCEELGWPSPDPRQRPYTLEVIDCTLLQNVTAADIGEGIEVLEFPLSDGVHRAAVLYIRPHPHIERLKAEGRVRTWPLRAK